MTRRSDTERLARDAALAAARHDRQVALVRASLLRGIDYAREGEPRPSSTRL